MQGHAAHTLTHTHTHTVTHTHIVLSRVLADFSPSLWSCAWAINLGVHLRCCVMFSPASADALFRNGRRSTAQRGQICCSVAAFEFFLHQDLSYCYLFAPERSDLVSKHVPCARASLSSESRESLRNINATLSSSTVSMVMPTLEVREYGHAKSVCARRTRTPS